MCLASGVHAACPPAEIDERVAVEYVHDGDTVRLADGRSLRLVGLDTPELARDGRPDEPLARTARDRLRDLVSEAGMRLELDYDDERLDRYGRTLAHAYLADGRSVTAQLLGEGLATALTVPPNLASWTCYRDAERAARDAGRGLWGLPGYRPLEARALDRARRGFTLVRGLVTAVEPRRSGLRVVFEGRFVAWIPRDHLEYFPDLQALVGRRVEVRGHLRPYRDELQINVRHPAALAPIAAESDVPARRGPVSK
ncbi:MAG: thermonuclease family protein [Gammaproteobacteria bacterium]|nr:thermonuclease family protein [Gammaproteobacteria bacterium]